MCVYVCECVHPNAHVGEFSCVYNAIFVVCILSVYSTSVMRESNSLGAGLQTGLNS